MRPRTATVRRRSAEPVLCDAASSSRQRAPTSAAPAMRRRASPSGPWRASTARRKASSAESPAVEPAARRSRSCGTSRPIARARRRASRRRPREVGGSATAAPCTARSRGRGRSAAAARGRRRRRPALRRRSPRSRDLQESTGSTGTPRPRGPDPRATDTRPSGVPSAPWMSRREVTHRKAKNPTGKEPEDQPEKPSLSGEGSYLSPDRHPLADGGRDLVQHRGQVTTAATMQVQRAGDEPGVLGIRPLRPPGSRSSAAPRPPGPRRDARDPPPADRLRPRRTRWPAGPTCRLGPLR